MHSKLIFIHIPKTAGTTLSRIFKENYFFWPKARVCIVNQKLKEKPLLAMSPEQRERLKLVHGHLIFGIHQYLPGEWKYVTVLRDPVKRVLSFYNHIWDHPRHYLHEKVTHEKMGIEDLMLSGATEELDNLQVRMLAGIPKGEVPFGQISPAHLAQAKQNVEAHFPIVGIASHFDESLLLMRKIYAWNFFPFYVRGKVNHSPRLPYDQLSEESRRLIRDTNIYDMELYDWAKGRLLEQIAQEGDRLTTAVRRFRRINKVFQKMISLTPIYKSAGQ